MAKNYKVHCAGILIDERNPDNCQFVEAPTSDTSSGHGTHVAGIVAGDGTASNGTFRGVAPGASLFGFGLGEANLTIWSAEALGFILKNYDTFVPRIRVVSNSYGACSADLRGECEYDPEGILEKLATQLVANGASVVWAAANEGGDGSVDHTNAMSKNPTPGVISVANYDDDELGSRNAGLDPSSSRGRLGAPQTYPDISAPGSSITATCSPRLVVCDAFSLPEQQWAPWYSRLSGTSMATPHVSGAMALLYQARPELTPAQAENLIQDTAHKFTSGGQYEPDPQNPGGTTSFDKGAGLLDVQAALEALGTAREGASPASTTADDDLGDFPGAAAADLVGFSARSETDGVRYEVRVASLDDAPSVGYTIRQLIDGVEYRSRVDYSAATGPAVAYGGVTEVSADLESDAISFFIPYSNLGDPAPNTPAHGVYLNSFFPVASDHLPGGAMVGAAIVRPEFVQAYTLRPTALAEPSPSPIETPSPTPTESPSATPSPTPTGPAHVVYEAQGEIRSPNRVGLTLFEFESVCPAAAQGVPLQPQFQGLDAFVFELPETPSSKWTATATSTGSSSEPDLSLWFFEEGCPLFEFTSGIGVEDEPLPAGTKYVVVYASTGTEMTVNLKITDTGYPLP